MAGILNVAASFAEMRADLAERGKETKFKKTGKKRLLAAWDCETDPFKYGRVPEPFTCGIAIGDDYFQWWGDDCLYQFLDFLLAFPEPLRIYAHNGGKFDFVFLLRAGLINRGDPIKIINGRIVEAKIGNHILRDSYSIIPVPLSKFDKTEIDYNIMEKEHRDNPQNKAEILAYQQQDCKELLRLVTAFNERFGPRLTIGGTAIKILREMHPFDSITAEQDARIRPYYFGGRVQCFETGTITGDLKVFDVNSMYPFVMAECEHFSAPFSEVPGRFLESAIDRKTGLLKLPGIRAGLPYMVTFTGKNKNALPVRTKEGLDFTVSEGEFRATSHEVKTALEFGLIEIEEVKEILVSAEPKNFSEFVNTFISEKIEAKKVGDDVAELFAKILLNSSYGKTAQNPANYFDWLLIDESELSECLGRGWICEFDYSEQGIMIMKRPCEEQNFFDVGIGASITGAARAVMLRAIAQSERPIYCDTDSLICEGLNGVPLDPYQLGAWDCEGRGETCFVYGKKVYALHAENEYSENVKKGAARTGYIKTASKGVRLLGDDVKRLAGGETVAYAQDAPTFKLTGGTEFTQRFLGAEKHTKLFDKFGKKIAADT